MLYLGSQVENFRLFDESTNKLPGNEIEDINKINQILKENFIINNFNNNQGADQNSALLSSDNSNSCEGNATSYVTVSTTFQGPPKETNINGAEAVQKSAHFFISNDLMTDDEKENNLSY
jgi:hypothetical protein